MQWLQIQWYAPEELPLPFLFWYDDSGFDAGYQGLKCRGVAQSVARHVRDIEVDNIALVLTDFHTLVGV